jgi:hypothetical protein
MKLFRFQFLGLPDLSTFVQHTKTEKMYQMTIQYTKCPQKDQMATKRPNGHEINQQLPLQDPPKFTKIGIVGLKIYHLASGSHVQSSLIGKPSKPSKQLLFFLYLNSYNYIH